MLLCRIHKIHHVLLPTNSTYVLLPLPVSSVAKAPSLLSWTNSLFSLLQQLPVCSVATTPSLLLFLNSLFALLLFRFSLFLQFPFALLLLLPVWYFTKTPCFLCCYNSLFGLMLQSPVLYVVKTFCLLFCYKSNLGLLQLLHQTNYTKCHRNIPQHRSPTWKSNPWRSCKRWIAKTENSFETFRTWYWKRFKLIPIYLSKTVKYKFFSIFFLIVASMFLLPDS